MNKNQKTILLVGILITILFLVLSKVLEPQIYRYQEYTDRDDIAIYIYKYNELPKNYVMNVPGASHEEVSRTLSEGKSYGGAIFRYENAIMNYTNNHDLKEADYYPNLAERIEEGNRGTYRFVFTYKGEKEIFYTEDHYDTFTKMNVSKEFTASKVMTALECISYGGVVVLIVQHQVTLNRRKKDE